MRSYFLVFFIYLINSLPIQAEENMSYGLKIPNTPIYLGGYLSGEYNKEEKKQFVFDDIALLFYSSFEKFNLLGEIEASDVELDESNIIFNLERLQIAYHINDDAIIYIGKFNTNMGYWNRAPVNILEDTTTKPHILKNIFPNLTTGISYQQQFKEKEKELILTLQHNDNLDKKYNNILNNRHYALSYKSFEESFSWSIGGGYFHTLNKTDSYYAGVGFEKESLDWTILSELFSKKEEKGDSIPYDGYLQLTRHIYYRHDIVFRTEFYKDEKLNIHENISLLGYTYRPLPSIAIKGEYIKHTILPKSRIVLSISAIF